jgi:hypothetical protein
MNKSDKCKLIKCRALLLSPTHSCSVPLTAAQSLSQHNPVDLAISLCACHYSSALPLATTPIVAAGGVGFFCSTLQQKEKEKVAESLTHRQRANLIYRTYT